MSHIFSDNNNIWVAHFKTFNCFMTQALVFQISLSFAAEPFLEFLTGDLFLAFVTEDLMTF